MVVSGDESAAAEQNFLCIEIFSPKQNPSLEGYANNPALP
jgi:hypothetical protein